MSVVESQVMVVWLPLVLGQQTMKRKERKRGGGDVVRSNFLTPQVMVD